MLVQPFILIWISNPCSVVSTPIECVHVTSSNSQIQTKEPLKVLSTSGIRGTKSIPVYNFPAQEHPSFGNYHLLNFEVMVVRDISRRV